MSKLKHYKMFINGEWVDSESKKTFETLNPENNKPWAIVPEASVKDVNNAVLRYGKVLTMQAILKHKHTNKTKIKLHEKLWLT